MQWNSASEFFAMGGYGLYVWGSFGVTAAVMTIEVFLVNLRRRQVLRNLRSEIASESTSS
ncbi:heme exporter protein CcmD [Rhodoferax sp.]|uniref:heme exporter protein CcmD n=1 Tax=Rhodoferax sp. TaxID=50421 RepID=UPI0027607737|nr:heme exporter protein CcmD [Rhodoferax sp.]